MSPASSPPPDLAHLLERPLFAHLATVDRSGAPRVSPMWFLWDGSRLRFTHTTARQKYEQVRADPRVGVSILDPADPYRFLEVDAEVELIEPDPTGAFFDRLAERYGVDFKLADPSDRVVLVARPVTFRRHP
jgi:PPOX class probable F420-dependent enzyme